MNKVTVGLLVVFTYTILSIQGGFIFTALNSKLSKLSPNNSSTTSILTNPQKAKCLLECLRLYEPLCGSDGITYSNDCVFERARCHNSSLQIIGSGPCMF